MDIILRAIFRTSHGPYRAGDTYLLDLATAVTLRSAGVLLDQVEICDPQVATVSAAARADIADIFAPAPDSPTFEPLVDLPATPGSDP